MRILTSLRAGMGDATQMPGVITGTVDAIRLALIDPEHLARQMQAVRLTRQQRARAYGIGTGWQPGKIRPVTQLQHIMAAETGRQPAITGHPGGMLQHLLQIA